MTNDLRRGKDRRLNGEDRYFYHGHIKAKCTDVLERGLTHVPDAVYFAPECRYMASPSRHHNVRFSAPCLSRPARR